MSLPPYAELHAVSNFTFLRGASHPEELVTRAKELGYAALALTDEASLSGIVKAHVAAKEVGLKLLVGIELRLTEGVTVVLLAADRDGYGNLCELITRGRRASPKGTYHLGREDLADGVPGCLALLVPFAAGEAWVDPSREGSEALLDHARWVAGAFPDRSWLAVELLQRPEERARLALLREVGVRAGLPLVAAGGVHMHLRSRRVLQDTLTAIRLGIPVAEAGHALHPNGERHLRSREVLEKLYPPELLEETLRVAERCSFSLDELRYEYPDEVVPRGRTPSEHLRSLTEAGASIRWPQGTPEKVLHQLEHELALVAELGYEKYFLAVDDIVRFARGRGILCQGRGSAANSAVCYCLGITEVDPSRMEMLFERFLSKERNEPPDIDIDFEHHRREEVIQYLYAKYGRDRAALTATLITYRRKSAVRDVGKALGLDLEQVDRIAKQLLWWDEKGIPPERLQEAGFDPGNPVLRRLTALAGLLVGFPRHLSQHVGGFVISRGPLSRLVPIENAAMPERTIIQWDKDDLDSLGLLKVDCLALGMLTAIHRALDLAGTRRGRTLNMADVPPEDPDVYRMIQKGDTVGVFQIESRAQMAMLPRLKPKTFYDLVVEVAIVRPGPIQGQMVHPYLRRRRGEEPVTYPNPAVKEVLERTLGVPIFQEQVMKLAVVAAGFTPGEADQLRRAMAAWRRKGSLGPFEAKLVEGMRERGYPEDFARQIYQQIRGFGEYGFPESHAASFALLVYVSAWLKYHEPAAFTCALLNSQPMGFYSPSQLVQDARRHGVEVWPVDVRFSEWECTLEAKRTEEVQGQPPLRLGLCLVKGLSAQGATALLNARREGSFASVEDLVSRSSLSSRDAECLAAAGALKALAGHRLLARWKVLGSESAPPPLLKRTRIQEPLPFLARPTEREDLVADYQAVGLTLGRHPIALLRDRLRQAGIRSATEIARTPHGRWVTAAGLVVNRQRPGTASGVTFVTLEDETGNVNVVVWRDLAERQRRELLGARLLGVRGTLESDGEVVHLIAKRLEDHSELLGDLVARSRDFR